MNKKTQKANVSSIYFVQWVYPLIDLAHKANNYTSFHNFIIQHKHNIDGQMDMRGSIQNVLHCLKIHTLYIISDKVFSG